MDVHGNFSNLNIWVTEFALATSLVEPWDVQNAFMLQAIAWMEAE